MRNTLKQGKETKTDQTRILQSSPWWASNICTSGSTGYKFWWSEEKDLLLWHILNGGRLEGNARAANAKSKKQVLDKIDLLWRKRSIAYLGPRFCWQSLADACVFICCSALFYVGQRTTSLSMNKGKCANPVKSAKENVPGNTACYGMPAAVVNARSESSPSLFLTPLTIKLLCLVVARRKNQSPWYLLTSETHPQS